MQPAASRRNKAYRGQHSTPSGRSSRVRPTAASPSAADRPTCRGGTIAPIWPAPLGCKHHLAGQRSGRKSRHRGCPDRPRRVCAHRTRSARPAARPPGLTSTPPGAAVGSIQSAKAAGPEGRSPARESHLSLRQYAGPTVAVGAAPTHHLAPKGSKPAIWGHRAGSPFMARSAAPHCYHSSASCPTISLGRDNQPRGPAQRPARGRMLPTPEIVRFAVFCNANL